MLDSFLVYVIRPHCLMREDHCVCRDEIPYIGQIPFYCVWPTHRDTLCNRVKQPIEQGCVLGFFWRWYWHFANVSGYVQSVHVIL